MQQKDRVAALLLIIPPPTCAAAALAAKSTAVLLLLLSRRTESNLARWLSSFSAFAFVFLFARSFCRELPAKVTVVRFLLYSKQKLLRLKTC